MRHSPIGWLLLLGCGLLGPSSFAQDQPVSEGKLGQAITQFVRQAHDGIGFSGAVLCAHKGKVVAAIAVGSTNGKKPAPIKTTTLFEIASVTKPFTATAILMLRDRGKLKLDDSISKHLPGVPRNCRQITIRHLLQHTSGIPGNYSRGRGTDLALVLPRFLAGGPQFPPGTHWEYWNQGYSLLSEVIARASGKSYVQFCRDEIFKPTKMNSSCFNGDKPRQGVTVAIGKSSRGNRSALDHPYGEYGFQYRGMGGLVTNVWDIWRWDRALKTGKLLKHKSQEEMLKAGKFRYGLGWRVNKTKGGLTYHSHSGSVRGFVAEIRRYPSKDACLIVLSNTDLSMPLFMTSKGCEQLLLGHKPTLQLPLPLKGDLLKQITGKYEDGRHRILAVEAQGKAARAKIIWRMFPPTHAYIGLDQQGKLRLFDFRASYPIAFERDKNGQVTRASLLKISFKRK